MAAVNTQREQRGVRPGGLVQWISILIAVGLAVLAFLTSFEGLSDLARTHRAFPDGWAWVLPTLVDGMAIVAGMVWYVRHIHGEKPGYAALLVVLAAVASVAANMTHAPVGCFGDCTMTAAELAARAAQGTEQVNVVLSKILAGLPPVAFGATWHLIQDEMGRRHHRNAARQQLAAQEQTALEAAAERERQAREEAANQAAARRQVEEETARQIEAIQADTRRLIEDAEGRAAQASQEATRAAAAREVIEQQAAQQLESLRAEARRQLEAVQGTIQRVKDEARQAVEAAHTAAAREIETAREQAQEARRALPAATTRQVMPPASSGSSPRRSARSDEVQAALEAAYRTNPTPDAWSKRSLAARAEVGETAARQFLQAKRAAPAADDADEAAAEPGRELMRVAS